MTGEDGTSPTPDELQAQRAAEVRGEPFLVYGDGAGGQRIFALQRRGTAGPSLDPDLVLGWDPQVSSTQAQCERLGDDRVLIDDWLSPNGSFVNGEGVQGRRRLVDGDALRFASPTLAYRAPYQAGSGTIGTPRPPDTAEAG